MDGDLSAGLDNLERILANKSKRPGKLQLSVLRHITENFSVEREIGEGGCGRVYKGILPSGQMVAVKKLLNDHKDENMFVRELTAMMMAKHENIVRFLGYCSHAEGQSLQMQGKYILADKRESLLCFEYISNGSLDNYITDELRGLEWDTRFQIIRGVCEGLRHLHYMGKQGIIHMDLKPANILLDHDMVPKITDFGISRLGDVTKTLSQGRMYSPQYCAPEYILDGIMSCKSDIYSLGVIIIEMVTGTRNNNIDITMVCRRWRHRWNKSVKHTTLGWQQQVTKCLELAQRCKNKNPDERPDIQDIFCELSEMYRAFMDISDSRKSTIEQSNSFLEDMLGIEPLELHFSAELNKQISHSIELTNDTNDYIAFRVPLEEENMSFGVSVTRLLPFCVHPKRDIVPPRSSCIVTITLEALKKPLRRDHLIAELCVESTRVDKGLTSKDITADMFKQEPDKVIDAVNLTVSVQDPKPLLILEPPELRFPPIEANKLLSCSLQVANMTDDHVAFTFILPQGKVLYYQTMGTGIMPPWSTRGVVTDMFVKEEALAEMQCKDTCLVRSVVVGKGLRDDDVSVEFFNEQTGLQEVEVDIELAAPSSARRSMYNDDQDYWALDELDLKGDGAALVSPLSIETELLQIYPAELRFASEEGEEYLSLINKTDHDVFYAIYIEGREDDRVAGDRGIVLPQSTCAVLIMCPNNSNNNKKPYQVRVMMISTRSRYRSADDLFMDFTYDKREQVMNKVRADGGKAHEALLACVVSRVIHHPEHEVVLPMDRNGLEAVSCMDVHPTEPWVVTGHYHGVVCLWKMDPKTNVCKKMISKPQTGVSSFVESVKFIARMQWVACANSEGYITVYTYADDRLAEIKMFEAGSARVLAVHPSLPYLLSSKEDTIFLWDWDQGWKCTRHFSNHSRYYMLEVTFNPKDTNTFASLDDQGEINIWSLDSQQPTTTSLHAGTRDIAYCNTGSNLQFVATKNGKICLDLWSNTNTNVRALEVTGIRGTLHPKSLACQPKSLACHPKHPLLVASHCDRVFLWNCTTYGVIKVLKVNTGFRQNVHLGFIDKEGFQRLVIAHDSYLKMVDCGH